MYKIVGGNQKEYGPVSADEVVEWIAEKRANRQTLALLVGSDSWLPLSDFPEFAEAFDCHFGPLSDSPSTGAPPSPAPVGTKRALLIPAVLVSLFCCPIFGPVAVTLAALADAKWELGDNREAVLLTKRAQYWIWVALGLGITAWLIFFLLSVISEK
ncbi:MAG: CD225/dispanin family protein [Verrucomicrobiia bacterium]|jgi:hypothetical protein